MKKSTIAASKRNRKGQGQRPDLGLIKRNQYIPIGVPAFGHHIAAMSWQQRFGQNKIQIILFEPASGTHLDHVAKTPRGDQGGLCPAPLNQRVGGQRRAMDDLPDTVRRGAGLCTDPLTPFDDRILASQL